MTGVQTCALPIFKDQIAADTMANSVLEDEIIEMITHLAFYAGWPVSMSAANVAKKVFEGEPK